LPWILDLGALNQGIFHQEELDYGIFDIGNLAFGFMTLVRRVWNI